MRLAGEGSGTLAAMTATRLARYKLGDVVRHRLFPFRGVIYDVDPTFSNTEEWYESIPAEIRPAKDQPYYHLLAENDEATYEAYVSEQNLLPDESGQPCRHPLVSELFEELGRGRYRPRKGLN
jgi:heat shock protein HspQ